MENKKNKIENIKETFTRDEIKIILYSISKNQDLAEKNLEIMVDISFI